MSSNCFSRSMSEPCNLSRRRFVQGVALGGAAMLGGLIRPAWAATDSTRSSILSGTDFALEIGETPVNFTGAARMATTVNGLLPGPTLRWREGTTVTLRVTNRLHVPTSIHWGRAGAGRGADRYARRRMLVLGALLIVRAGLVFLATGRFLLLLAAATIGVISPSGYEVGPFLAIEQAALSQTIADGRRTRIFA